MRLIDLSAILRWDMLFAAYRQNIFFVNTLMLYEIINLTLVSIYNVSRFAILQV